MKINNSLFPANSLFLVRPEIIEEWDAEQNKELNIYEITKGSDKKVWWICSHCSSNYNSSPNKRSAGRNCPYCSGDKVNNTNSLATVNPALSLEWHPEKNKFLTPNDVTASRDRKVWWLGKCGHEWEARIGQRHRASSGCPYCSGHKTLIGFNDFYTTHPSLAELLVNKEDGKVNSFGSNKKVLWKCSICEKVKKDSFNNVSSRGISCFTCSKKMSLPERVLHEILRSSGVNFIYDHRFTWSKGKKYDFYLPEYSCIIETHGEQHYNASFESIGGRTLEEEQENDAYKRKLSLENGIEFYIELDCRESDINFIKESIGKSNLPIIVPKINIDANLEPILNNENKRMIQAWVIWNNSSLNMKQIREILNISKPTLKKYLEIGSALNKCSYSKGGKRSV